MERQTLSNDRGALAVWLALMLLVLISFLAIAIDVGYMYATKNELQNAADASALAACGELGRKYLELGYSGQIGYNVTADAYLIIQAAKDVAAENSAAGVEIEVKDEDVVIGKWDWDKDADPLSNPTPNPIEPDAVQVTVRRAAGYAGGAVPTFFARILNIFGGNHNYFEASAVATAALSGPSSMAEGILKTPFGIADTWFTSTKDCPEKVTFKSSSACAGWHNYFDSPPYKNNPYSSDMGEKCLTTLSNMLKGQHGFKLISEITIKLVRSEWKCPREPRWAILSILLRE